MSSHLSFYAGAMAVTLCLLIAVWLMAMLVGSVARRTSLQTVPLSLPRQGWLAVGVFALLPPFLVTLHECGHYLAGVLFGYKAVFTHAEVNISASTRINPMHESIFILAGPLVEMILSVLGTVQLIRWARRSDRRASVTTWLWSALALACLRWLRADTGGVSDETKLSRQLGMEDFFIPSLLAVPCVVLVVVILLIHQRSCTLLPLTAGLAAGVGSSTLWLSTLGPMVFPPPVSEVALTEDKPLAEALLGHWVKVGTPGQPLNKPSIGSAHKLITKTQWIATSVDSESGALHHWHGGTYRLDGDEYAETVEHGIERASELMNRTFRFKIKVEGNFLTQEGIGNPWNEVWQRVE
jgi:hypothetical protein